MDKKLKRIIGIKRIKRNIGIKGINGAGVRLKLRDENLAN